MFGGIVTLSAMMSTIVDAKMTNCFHLMFYFHYFIYSRRLIFVFASVYFYYFASLGVLVLFIFLHDDTFHCHSSLLSSMLVVCVFARVRLFLYYERLKVETEKRMNVLRETHANTRMKKKTNFCFCTKYTMGDLADKTSRKNENNSDSNYNIYYYVCIYM